MYNSETIKNVIKSYYNNDLVNIGDDRFTIIGIINYINLKQDIRRVDYEVGV